MDGARFDSLTRQLGRSFSRRRFLGGAAGALALTAIPLRFAAAATDATDAKATIEQFYQNVDAYDYASAYALLGASWQQSQSQTAFTNGYGDTAFVELTILGTANSSNGTKQVNVKLTSWHNDATIHGYSGHYIVGQEGAEGRNTLILSADIKVASAPDVAPLCTLDDLSFAIGGGDAGAGNRFGTVIGTNESGSACVVGGSPALTLRNETTGNRLYSTSEAGSPAVGITLQPGGSATAQYRFANWCGSTDPSDFSLSVEVPGDFSQTTIPDGAENLSYPPCLGSGESALLGVQGWTAS
ncbi:MAG: DUF4232 domain-containing protein [Thermomicrobiales bacterium]